MFLLLFSLAKLWQYIGPIASSTAQPLMFRKRSTMHHPPPRARSTTNTEIIVVPRRAQAWALRINCAGGTPRLWSAAEDVWHSISLPIPFTLNELVVDCIARLRASDAAFVMHDL
ncbi:uncharacterized protein EI90DRAFT_3041060 [Cantharellus anzutake]|uniref:uncharacterized protein n=1 Tax=Cantharellus anzutake TaxID=1750568 RepID=UPI0019043D4C|nr:uncharacterized protein EI90DRAFT_3041060 [Cantharellus anzutake]KAF8337927.1 hypothetical protein EI90DRAFT_3041060 [Cantharellus anzutake]